MNIKKLKVSSADYPERLKRIGSPPQYLYYAGSPLKELLKRPAVAIVGTRKISSYGSRVTWEFASYLARQGMVIVSGLALGLDAAAHRAALDSGGTAIAVLPGPLDCIVPKTNRHLAGRILDSGGTLVSEYEGGDWPKRQYFIARNRIVAGLADAILIPEAGEKSGAMHTARFALENGKNILAVPGDINSAGSVGTNNLIKTSRAGAVTSPQDVLSAMDLLPHTTDIKQVKGRNAHEQKVLELMLGGTTDGHELLSGSGLGTSEFNRVLTMLEIGGKIRPLGANHWSIR